MKTARGVYHDITLSEYTYTIDTITFYFSSEFYRDKFISEYEIEKDRFNQALNNVYKDRFSIKADVLAWVRLYTLIEKRGFYIIVNGVHVECLDNLAFVLEVEKSTTTMRNYEDSTN